MVRHAFNWSDECCTPYEDCRLQSWDDMVSSVWKLFASLLCWFAILGVMAHC